MRTEQKTITTKKMKTRNVMNIFIFVDNGMEERENLFEKIFFLINLIDWKGRGMKVHEE